MKTRPEMSAKDMLNEGIAEMSDQMNMGAVIDPEDEAAVRELLERYVFSEIDEVLDRDSLIECLIYEVDGLVETWFPDSALIEIARQNSLCKTDKLELLRRYRSSVFFSEWVKDGGQDDDLDELEKNWMAESD
jgi:hypothetical protein